MIFYESNPSQQTNSCDNDLDVSSLHNKIEDDHYNFLRYEALKNEEKSQEDLNPPQGKLVNEEKS